MKNRFLTAIIALLFLFCAIGAPLFAEEPEPLAWRWGVQSAYYFPHQNGLNSQNGWDPLSYEIAPLPSPFSLPGNDPGRSLGTGWGALELQGWVDGTKEIPLLRGDGPLTSGNNLRISGKMNLSPATTDLNLTFRLTPVAFLYFEQGNHLGTGWNAGIANGLGLNSDGTGHPVRDPFPGVVYRGFLSGTFQFDLAAVLPEPKDWKHVILSATAKLQYQLFSAAGDNDPWQYQADSGENFNGWQFHSSTVLGFMPPGLPINLAGIMMETERRLGDIADSSTMASGGWGSDLTKVRVGPLFNWAINEDNGLTVLIQWHNAVQYDDTSVYYNDFRNRTSTGGTYWYFDRIAFAYTMNL